MACIKWSVEKQLGGGAKWGGGRGGAGFKPVLLMQNLAATVFTLNTGTP